MGTLGAAAVGDRVRGGGNVSDVSSWMATVFSRVVFVLAVPAASAVYAALDPPVAGRTNVSLPLALGAGSNLAGALQVVPGGHNCTPHQSTAQHSTAGRSGV